MLQLDKVEANKFITRDKIIVTSFFSYFFKAFDRMQMVL